MTKRLSVVALSLVAALAVAVTAQAASGLTVRSAQKLARALAQKQVRNRDVISFHVLKGKRTRSGSVLFAYDDRSTTDVYCTAVIVVRQQTVHGRVLTRAGFRGQRCGKIPADALAYEAAVRNAQREMRGTALATKDAVRGVSRSLNACSKLKVPKARRSDVNLIVNTAFSGALAKPNDAILGGLVNALLNVGTPNAPLSAGAAAWSDELSVLRALPAIPDPCAALKSWAAKGWASNAAPVDIGGLHALDARATIDQRTIARVADVLATDGIAPPAVLGFTPRGLLLDLVPKVGITGGR